MTEGNAVIANEEVAQEQSNQQQELAMLRAMAFQGVVPNQAEPTNEAQTQAESANDIVADTNNDTEVVDVVSYLKNNFGFENEDQAKAAFNEYNELKTKVQQPAQPQFANEETRLWYDYITNGKEEELYTKLGQRREVKNVDNLSDQDKLKLYIHLQNPLFDDELINDEYNSLYTVSEERFKNDLDEVDQLALRKEKLRAQQRIMNDVGKANEYFGQYKSKIELQPIQQAQNVDPNYEAYKSSMEKDMQEYTTNIEPAIKSLKQEELAMQFKIEDAQNQMDFNLSIEVTPEDLEQAKANALDFENFLNKNIYKDNKFMANNYAKLLLVSQNFDKYVRSAARQAVMAERKRVTTSNAQGGIYRGNGNGARDYNLEPLQAQQGAYNFAFPNGKLQG